LTRKGLRKQAAFKPWQLFVTAGVFVVLVIMFFFWLESTGWNGPGTPQVVYKGVGVTDFTGPDGRYGADP